MPKAARIHDDVYVYRGLQAGRQLSLKADRIMKSCSEHMLLLLHFGLCFKLGDALVTRFLPA